METITKREEIINDFMEKKVRLSYSTLKNFTSPVNLINYKLKPKSSSPSMIFGSLCDVLLLTPNDFDKQFVITENIPNTDNQQNFANHLITAINDEVELNEKFINEVFNIYYSRGNALKTYNSLESYIRGKAFGKECVSKEIYNEAKELIENLLLSKDIQSLFSQIISVQNKISWKYKGWSFIGFLDMYLEDHIIDLKFSKDANPEKFERDIANFDYFLQAAMYCIGAKESGLSKNPRYSFIVYDKSFNYSIIDLDYTYLMYGERKYNYLLQELDRCIESGSFDKSYDFFKRIYTVYKPKWAKGYALKSDEQE